MKTKPFTPTLFNSQKNVIETQIDEDYCIELGTYLPMKKRIEDMKQSGIDLLAYRQAYSMFSNGTGDIKLDQIEMSEMTDDEIDLWNKKQIFLDRFKAEEERKIALMKEHQNTIQEKAKKYDEMQAQAQKTQSSENAE